jgi:hypothetical protein
MAGETSYLGPIFGGLITLVGSWGAIVYTKNREEERESRQLAGAFKGEITALIHIAELRNYSGKLREISAVCRLTNQSHLFGVPVRDEYRAVYKANVGKLGIQRFAAYTNRRYLYAYCFGARRLLPLGRGSKRYPVTSNAWNG